MIKRTVVAYPPVGIEASYLLPPLLTIPDSKASPMITGVQEPTSPQSAWLAHRVLKAGTIMRSRGEVSVDENVMAVDASKIAEKYLHCIWRFFDVGVSQESIRAVHGILLGKDALQYRLGDAWIGSTHTPAGAICCFPPSRMIDEYMRNFVEAYRANGKGVQEATISYYQLCAIHPFSDGNGRVARVLASLLLIDENDVLQAACISVIAAFKKRKLVDGLRRAEKGWFRALERTWEDIARTAENLQSSLISLPRKHSNEILQGLNVTHHVTPQERFEMSDLIQLIENLA